VRGSRIRVMRASEGAVCGMAHGKGVHLGDAASRDRLRLLRVKE